MPIEMVLLTDDDAMNLIDNGVAAEVGNVTECPGSVVVPPNNSQSIELIPRIVNEFNNGRDIIATPHMSEVLKAFGVSVSSHYPVVFPYIDIYTESIGVPNVEVIRDNNALWSSVDIGITQSFPRHVSGMNGSKAMMWLTNSPGIHPAVTLDIANSLSEIYDFVFLCGNSDIELDLYKDLCYNGNVIDVVGRIGSWSSVVEFANICDTILSTTHWLVNIMHNVGKQCQIIGPSLIEGLDGVGTPCEYDMNCGTCMYDYCPCTSSIEAGVDDGCITFNIGGA
jgi:hypothetical protein